MKVDCFLFLSDQESLKKKSNLLGNMVICKGKISRTDLLMFVCCIGSQGNTLPMFPVLLG